MFERAVAFSTEHGAPGIEGYPVDNCKEKANLTMAYVGARVLFERAGFSKVAETASVLDGFARVVMRFGLRASRPTSKKGVTCSVAPRQQTARVAS